MVSYGEVSNECWSCEMCGAKRLRRMGPPSVVPISRTLIYKCGREKRGRFNVSLRKYGKIWEILYKSIIDFSWLGNSVS